MRSLRGRIVASLCVARLLTFAHALFGGWVFLGWATSVSDPPARIRLMTNLTSMLNQLEQERTRLAFQLESLNNALSALNAKGSSRRGRMSAAGRARVATALRARWAKVKGKKVVSITAHKRRMSPAARRRIAAAQKARWAKWRKAQKKG
jgi:hypothetical protein